MYCRPATRCRRRSDLVAGSHRQTGICRLCVSNRSVTSGCHAGARNRNVATRRLVNQADPLYIRKLPLATALVVSVVPAACSPMLLPEAPVTSPAKGGWLCQPLCYSSARLVRYRWYLPDTGRWYRRRYWQSWCRREVYTVGGVWLLLPVPP